MRIPSLPLPRPDPLRHPQAQAPALHFDFGFIDRLPYIDTAGCRIFVGRDAGMPRPALLFVAGAYHGAWCYSNYLDFFSRQGISCYAIDLPGHGSLATPDTPVDLDIDALGRHLERACQALGRPLVLVGHSMGALPVLLAASRGAAAGVALLAPSPPGNLPGALALPAAPPGLLRPPPADEEIRKRFLAVADDRDVGPIAARLRPESPAILNDRYLLRVAIDPEALACPGICLEAQWDTPDRHPPGQDRAIADFLGWRHAVLARQPHCMMYADRWAESATALLDWYRNLFLSADADESAGTGTGQRIPF